MAEVRRWNPTKSLTTRRRADGKSNQGSGLEKHMLTGTAGSGDNAYTYRSLVQFDHDWSGIGTLIKAELVVRTEDDSTHFTFGTKPRIRASRNTKAWPAQQNNAENVWTTDEYFLTTTYGGQEMDLPINPQTGKPQDEVWVRLDITPLMQGYAPANVAIASGGVGNALANYGFVLRAPGSEETTAQRGIMYSAQAASGFTPYVWITYDPLNRPPTAPTLLQPPAGNNNFGQNFEGQHNDPDLNPMGGRYIRVWRKGISTGEPTWEISTTKNAELSGASSEETQTGRFSVPLSLATAALKLQTDYEWEAATKDSLGRVGPYSARRSLKITSSPPTVVAADVSSVAAMADVMLGGTYSDPANSPLDQFQMQMQHASAHTDLAFADPGTYDWDSGETPPTDDEVASNVIRRVYGGQPLGAGTYTYRIKVRNSTGVWSTWSYDDFTLTADYNLDPGDVDLTTQIARYAPVRVALFGMTATRGPGALIGYVDDPIDLGASAYLNGAGEVYFSLPALHPYCPAIEPHQVHYQVQQYYGDRYRVLFSGIITDFDADPDKVTFYGTDYMGLLQTAVDERYDPAKAELAAPTGSKYVNQTLDFIIKDQLTYHKNLSNSATKFIAVNASHISALAERATIYSTYAEALPFITGLIDSHKQGTGREARFYARPTDTNFMLWEWALTDNWGHDRPNIELEYGGLLNDFRIVALGDFGTRVLGIGQKRGEVKVYRATGTGGLNEALWGRRAKTAFFPDIIDQNDLQRRVNENASMLAKVGKRMALAIRADMLSPFDGWDLGDSIKVNIVRGVVDTSRYGSLSLWTVYGVEWRYYTDGHTDMTLTIMPKKTATPPSPDLIPSINPGVPIAWQVGYGVPTTYGEPPSNTPPAARQVQFAIAEGRDSISTYTYLLSTDPVQAAHYEDLNTGCVYELDEATGNYLEVYCPTATADTGFIPDVTPPDAPVIKATSSQSSTQDDGTSLTAISATVGYATAPVMSDLDLISMQSTRFGRVDDPTQPDWTLATQWTTASADETGAQDTTVIQPSVNSATLYWLRASAVDVSGNRSGWSPTVTITTATDSIAPPVPTGIVVQAGMSTLGIRWTPIPVSDMAYVEVQWRVSPSGNWISARVAGTLIVVSGLTNGPPGYDVRLRSVDTSGNTLRGTGDTVRAVDFPEAGWVTAATAIQPTTLPGSAFVWDQATVNTVFAGKINADWITAGTLRVGGSSGNAAAITVYDASGRLIGRWSTAGIEVLDPDNPNYKLVIDEASLVISDITNPASPVPVVTMNPLGIDAASITFGSARGGHNLIQNSSFELGRFVQSPPFVNTWDQQSDWTATRQGSDDNISYGAGDFSMGSVT